MLKSWIFSLKNALIRTIKLILLITHLHSQGLKRSIGDVGANKKKFDVFNTVLALQMKYVIMECISSHILFFGLYQKHFN
jgi:hypothetical protein